IFSVPWHTIESKGAIFLVEDTPEVLVMKAQRNLGSPLLKACAYVPFGHCLCGRAASSASVEFASCVDDRHDTRYDGMQLHGHYIVPIVFRGKVQGVLNLYVAEGHVRDLRQEEFLRTVADLLSGILVHKKTQGNLETALERLRKTLGSIIQAMGSTLESRDPYTAGHQRRVADLARAIATEMGLPADTIESIRSAATIHDIGKISVPAEILSKPGKLTSTELELIEVHPKVGYDILRNIDFPWPIAQIVLQHHERLDGSGYPAGLCGEHILTEARILSIADVVEAMATHRPYRPSLGLKGALAEISRNKGILYDVAASDACLRLFNEKKYVILR
ncbi:MAG: HD domain-containing protein, partial [Acidobacteria bacterium]|nr:HD domain-containing protein [Acidobacteriota bacterium]